MKTVATYPPDRPAAVDPDWAKPIRHDVDFCPWRFDEALKELAAGDLDYAQMALESFADRCQVIAATCRRVADSIKNDPAAWGPDR